MSLLFQPTSRYQLNKKLTTAFEMATITELVKQFQFEKLLKTDPQTKTIALLGKIKDQDAIVSLEKSHFIVDENAVKVDEIIDTIEILNENDVYFWSKALLKQDIINQPGAKLNLIYPATETHIRKYEEQLYHYILETPEMYNKYVIPYINSMKGDRIKWVYNILFEGKESESFVYHDKDPENGFVLLPDMKWDGINMDSLYLCCIVNRLDISSVRDLNGTHLDFLIGLQKEIKQKTQEKYPVESDQLRVFVHYQPSYYHFHIHVVNNKHPGLGDGIAVGKAILLDTVIENLKLMSDYYSKVNIGYNLGENHKLWSVTGYIEEHYKNSRN